METIKDYQNRNIRFTDDRKDHIEQDPPEMLNQYDKIKDTLKSPFMIIRSKTDNDVELFYKKYARTPVTEKYLCIVIKSRIEASFIITAYFTDTIKKGEILWEEK